MAASPARIWRSWRIIPLVALGSALTLLLAGVIAGLYGERLYQAQKVREVGVRSGCVGCRSGCAGGARWRGAAGPAGGTRAAGATESEGNDEGYRTGAQSRPVETEDRTGFRSRHDRHAAAGRHRPRDGGGSG